MKTEKTIEEAWKKRLKLYAEGNRLYREGNKLWDESSKLHNEHEKLKNEAEELLEKAYASYDAAKELLNEADRLINNFIHENYGEEVEIKYEHDKAILSNGIEIILYYDGRVDKRTKVYIVDETWEFDGSEIIGVFSTRKKAEDFVKNFLEEKGKYWSGNVGIEEHEVK